MTRTITMLAVSLLLGGCGGGSGPVAGDPIPTGSGSRAGMSTRTPAGSPARAPAADPGREPTRVVGTSFDNNVMASVLPLGSVPYADFTLPLVSPDGRHIATETGIGPQWATAVADPGAPGHDATRIEIYQLDYEVASTNVNAAFNQEQARREPPTSLVAGLEVPLMLGRSGDRSWFLVEQATPAGGRRIGRARWLTGQMEWLVDDGGSVTNAFAALGPGGRLAWSRRVDEGSAFELCVRGGDGPEWTVSTGDDWLYPTWSGRDDGLFVYILRGERLALGFGRASSRAGFQQSLQTIDLIDSGATIDHAFGAQQAQPVMMDTPVSQEDELVFVHPAHPTRAAVWRPHAFGRSLSALEAGSYSAAVDRTNFALVTTADKLNRQSLLDERDRILVLRGLFIPRLTAAGEWPWMLLEPQPQARRVILRAMLLPGK